MPTCFGGCYLASNRKDALEGDFFDLTEFPEFVVLNPLGFARTLKQLGCVGGAGDAAMAPKELAVEPTRKQHPHDGCLRCNEASNEDGGPRHNSLNVLGWCDRLKPKLLLMGFLLSKTTAARQ